MGRRRRVLALAIVAATSASERARADEHPRTKEDFAAALAQDGDYFRAISVYKELAFFAEDPQQKARYAYRIGAAYRLAHRYDLAIDAFSVVLASPSAPPELAGVSYAQVGASYVGLKLPLLADPWLRQARAHGASPLAALYEGAEFAEAARYDESKRAFDEAAHGAPGTPLGTLAGALSARVARAGDVPHKSPALAGILSTVLPGAGQAYTGHWWDAFQALTFVGAFAFGSLLAYEHDHDHGGPYWLTGIALGITGIFHISNIAGAVRTAQYFNMHQGELFLEPIRSQVQDFEP
jgi:tetratricopeptide (TPR) repeat protein